MPLINQISGAPEPNHLIQVDQVLGPEKPPTGGGAATFNATGASCASMPACTSRPELPDAADIPPRDGRTGRDWHWNSAGGAAALGAAQALPGHHPDRGRDSQPLVATLSDAQQSAYRDQVRAALSIFYDLARDILKVTEDDTVRNELALQLIRSVHAEG
jgi:hypothetical protein